MGIMSNTPRACAPVVQREHACHAVSCQISTVTRAVFSSGKSGSRGRARRGGAGNLLTAPARWWRATGETDQGARDSRQVAGRMASILMLTCGAASLLSIVRPDAPGENPRAGMNEKHRTTNPRNSRPGTRLGNAAFCPTWSAPTRVGRRQAFGTTRREPHWHPVRRARPALKAAAQKAAR